MNSCGWGSKAFSNFRVVQPDTGIVHQVNLEYLARGVFSNQQDGKTVVYPDTVVGTDSHTTMINGLGVLGWGVGGIEAEAVMLGQPISMLVPQVIGFRLTGNAGRWDYCYRFSVNQSLNSYARKVWLVNLLSFLVQDLTTCL